MKWSREQAAVERTTEGQGMTEGQEEGQGMTEGQEEGQGERPAPVLYQVMKEPGIYLYHTALKNKN